MLLICLWVLAAGVGLFEFPFFLFCFFKEQAQNASVHFSHYRFLLFFLVLQQVLDRVSRMTQGDLVMSMDQLLTKPRLGTCHKFYMQAFQLPNGE